MWVSGKASGGDETLMQRHVGFQQQRGGTFIHSFDTRMLSPAAGRYHPEGGKTAPSIRVHREY
jgi:hypothetical protein